LVKWYRTMTSAGTLGEALRNRRRNCSRRTFRPEYESAVMNDRKHGYALTVTSCRDGWKFSREMTGRRSRLLLSYIKRDYPR